MPRRPLSFQLTLGAVIFCGLIFLGYYFGFARYSSSLLVYSLNPLIKAGRQAADWLGGLVSPYYQQKIIIKENEVLRQELVALAQKNVALATAQKENELLKKELQFLAGYQYDYLVAQVVGRSFDFEKNYFLINQGAGAGLYPGLAVTVDQGVVIGRLVKVEENFSEVQFLADNNSQIAVTIMGETAVTGLAKGEHNINLKIEMLPKEAKINPGDLVATSNLNLNIPPGLVLGKVQKIETSDNNLWQTAVAEPLADYSDISLVTVILPPVRQ